MNSFDRFRLSVPLFIANIWKTILSHLQGKHPNELVLHSNILRVLGFLRLYSDILAQLYPRSRNDTWKNSFHRNLDLSSRKHSISDYMSVITGSVTCDNPHFLFAKTCTDSISVKLLIPLPFLHATRVGEAKNPGPPSSIDTFRLCITNPTAILRKDTVYRHLADEYRIDCFTASETSATEMSQKIVTSKFRQDQLKIKWSPPVPDRTARTDGAPSMRGKAAGVAIFAYYPLREAIGTISPDWQATSRILHCVLSLGPLQIQLVAIYGVTSSHKDSSEYNSNLLKEAWQASRHLPLPTIILGDFNCEPTTLRSWEHLEAEGFQDLQKIHRQLYGTCYPATCKDVTSPDTAICCPQMTSWLRRIQVLEEYHFDTHKCSLLEFQIPQQEAFRHTLPMPKTWLSLNLTDDEIAVAYQDVRKQHLTPNSLEEWGKLVEDSIDLAFRRQQSTLLSQPISYVKPLPHNMRGRCRPRHMVKAPIRSFNQSGRSGDYMPHHEIHTFATQRKIKQVRRIQSLARNVARGLNLDGSNWFSWQQQWLAILRDRAFGGPFTSWCQYHADIGPLPQLVPAHDFLFHIYQLVKFETDRAVAADHKIWEKKQQFARALDTKWSGASKAFQSMKDATKPPITEIQQIVHQTAHAVPEDDGSYTLFLEPDHRIQDAYPVTVDQKECKVLAVERDFITIRPHDAAVRIVPEPEIYQHQTLFTPPKIFDALNDFWLPYWTQSGPPNHEESLEELLQSLPEHLPSIQVDLQNVDLWCDAIKSLKSISARGVDAISSSELKQLPRECITDLVHVMGQFTDGFPPWFMQAKCYPLPKVDRPQASQTRPITVLAQLYRLWSCVVSRQILEQYATYFPPGVTGMIPKRGAHDASYVQQFIIERMHINDVQHSGLCLDLVKCFNTIHRPSIVQLLHRLGIPSIVINQWQKSIDQLQRLWVINGEVSLPVPCSNGCPEGDTLSVVCMVSIAFLWVHLLQRHSPTATPSAYADNWSWLTESPQEHTAIVHDTLQVVKAFGMIVDWCKSWIWASNRLHQHAIMDALRPHLEPGAIQFLARAVDLGCQRTYSGPPRLGALRSKLRKATHQLTRLKAMGHSIDVKAKLVTSGVYPSVFYGCELVPIGEAHTNHLRAQVANGILGTSISRNSSIALLCTPGVLDPEIDLITRVMCKARRFLNRCSPQDREFFLKQTSLHNGLYHQCRGPIGCLKYYCLRLGWLIDAKGNLSVDAFHSISLITTSDKWLVFWITKAWTEHCLLFHTQRKALQGLPPICPDDTIQVLKRFDLKQQRCLLQEISGSFQTAVQQKAWDPSVSDICKFCDQQDTRYHRLCTCSAMQDILRDFATTIAYYEDQGHPIWELPVIHDSPDIDFHRIIHANQPEPVLDETFKNRVRDLNQLGHRVQLFTDGSCQHPASRNTRFSTFAIAIDLSVDEDMQRQAVLLYHSLDIVPECIKVVTVARTPGTQHIHRAELFAVLTCVEQFDMTCIHTDSQVVIDIVSNCRATDNPHSLFQTENFDLVLRLWNALHTGDHHIVKIKAHKEIAPVDDFKQGFLQLGNKIVNDAAITACWHLQADFVISLETAHRHLEVSKTRLFEFYNLILQIQTRRTFLDSQYKQDKDNLQTHGCRQLASDQLAQWVVSDPWVATPPRVQRHQYVIWGNTIASHLREWMTQLKWPKQSFEQDVGVTWIELSLSFAMFMGMPIPVKRVDSTGISRVIVIEGAAAIESYGVRLAEQANNFSILWKQMSDLQDAPFCPDIERGLVKSLYVLGATFFSSGFKWRPQFPYQQQVVTLMAKYLQTHRGTSFANFPTFDWAPKLDTSKIRQEIRSGWDNRAAAVHREAKAVRDWRRRPQRQLNF